MPPPRSRTPSTAPPLLLAPRCASDARERRRARSARRLGFCRRRAGEHGRQAPPNCFPSPPCPSNGDPHIIRCTMMGGVAVVVHLFAGDVFCWAPPAAAACVLTVMRGQVHAKW